MGLLALLAVVGTLTGTVGTNDAFQIGLTDPSGAPVQHLDPGTYTLVVHDNSSLHNFHLLGPGGVNVATDVDGKGDQTFTVTLVDGVYTFQCDPHSFSGMKGQFAVGSATLTTPKPTPKPTPTPTQKASGSITGSRAILAGAGRLKAGRVKLTISDRSKTDGFMLKGPGVSKKTAAAFTGSVAWTVTLRPGKYSYGSAKTAKGRKTFTVQTS